MAFSEGYAYGYGRGRQKAPAEAPTRVTNHLLGAVERLLLVHYRIMIISIT